MRPTAARCLVLSCCLAACGSPDDPTSVGPYVPGSPGSGGAGDAGPRYDAASFPSSTGSSAGSGSTGSGGAGDKCLVQPIDVRGKVPDLLIVMDRSLSMQGTRWQPSVQAVNMLVTQFQATVDFGLSVFPPTTVGPIDLTNLANLTGGCGDAVLDVPVAPNNAPPISAALAGMGPGGTTPTAAALTAALGFLGPRMEAGPDTAASKPAYVLLVTDGEPNCSANPVQDTANAAAALAAAGIKVYVVGYNVAGAAGTMNQIAQAGGTDHYYAVESPQDLEAAFQAVTKDVVRCDFDLATSTQNPDPKFIFVTIDGKEVPLSDADGWVVDGKHITLNGTACSSLKDGALHSVSAELRCEPLR